MSTREIYALLNTVFRDVFDDESLSVNAKTTANDIDDWDSIESIRLLATVEDEFSIRFRPNEVQSMQNVGDLVSIIARKCPEKASRALNND